MCEATERYGNERAENAGLDNLLDSINKIMAGVEIIQKKSMNSQIILWKKFWL